MALLSQQQSEDPVTERENEELSNLISRARARAEPVGPMHALWDMIGDAEALLEGKPTLLGWTKRRMIDELRLVVLVQPGLMYQTHQASGGRE